MTNRPSLLLAASLLLCGAGASEMKLTDAKSKSDSTAYAVFHDGCAHDGTDYVPYGRRTRRRGLGALGAGSAIEKGQGPYGPYGHKNKKDEAKPADMWSSGTKPVVTKTVQSGNVAKIKCNIHGSTNKTNKSGSYASAGGLANYYGSWGGGTMKSPKDSKAEAVTVVAATGSKSKKIYAGSVSGAGGSWGTGDYSDYPVKDHKAETVAVVASKSAKVYAGSAAAGSAETSWGSGTMAGAAAGSKSAKVAAVKDYKAKSQKSMSMADCKEVETKDGAGSKSAKAAIVTANGDAKAKSRKSKEGAVVGGTGTASWSKPVTRNGETTWGAADAPATTNGGGSSGKASKAPTTKSPTTRPPTTAKPKVKCKKTKSAKVAGNTVSATSSWGAATSHPTTKPSEKPPPVIVEPVAEVVVEETSRTVDACDALASNRLVSTDRPASVGYVYEAVVASDVSLKRVVANAEFSIGQYVGRAMMGCDAGRGRDLLASIGLRISQEGEDGSEKRRLEDETVVSTTNVVGLSDAPRDSSDTGGGCGYFVGTRAVKDEGCYTVTGGMTLYLTEDDYSDYPPTDTPPTDTSKTVEEEEPAVSTGTSKPIVIVEEDAASTGTSETVIVVEEDASSTGTSKPLSDEPITAEEDLVGSIGTDKPLSDEPITAEEDLVGSIGTDKPITITITAPISDEGDDSIGTSKELISAEEDFVGSFGTDKPLSEEGDAVGSIGTSKPLDLLEARLGGRRRMNEEEAAVDALKVLMDAMNSDSSPFVQGSGTRYAVEGLIAVRLVSGTTDGGTTIDIEADDPPPPPPPPPAVDGAKTTIQVSKNEEPMSPVGISLITIGIIALAVALAMFAMKKRRGHESFAILKDDTDTDLDEDSVNGAEFGGTRGRQGAYVVGEEGSVYTTQTTNTRDLFNSLGLYDEGGNGNDDGEQVDVHQCTSATCPICTARRGSTVFVPAVDDGPDGEAYEVDYRRSTGPAQGRDGSFEYKSSGSGASRPQFLNPAEIGRRPYEVGDTVDF